MTGYRFDVVLRDNKIMITETVELDGVPMVGHRLRVTLKHLGEVDLHIVAITWFHAPGALSKSGLLTLSESPP